MHKQCPDLLCPVLHKNHKHCIGNLCVHVCFGQETLHCVCVKGTHKAERPEEGWVPVRGEQHDTARANGREQSRDWLHRYEGCFPVLSAEAANIECPTTANRPATNRPETAAQTPRRPLEHNVMWIWGLPGAPENGSHLCKGARKAWPYKDNLPAAVWCTLPPW